MRGIVFRRTLTQWQIFFIEPFNRRVISQSPPRQSSRLQNSANDTISTGVRCRMSFTRVVTADEQIKVQEEQRRLKSLVKRIARARGLVAYLHVQSFVFDRTASHLYLCLNVYVKQF